MTNEALIPKVGVITDIRKDTPDVKTFRVVGLDGKKMFEHKPGQCAMLSMPGVGEALFSITSSPTNEKFMEFSIKKCGCVTDWLHSVEPGQKITVRGPYGNGFDVNLYKNKDYPALEKVFVPYTKAMVKSLKNDEVFIPDEELQHIYLDMLGVTGRTNLKKKVEKFWK